MRVWLPLLLTLGCVPELVSPNPPDLQNWTCPDNDWDRVTPSGDLAGNSYGFFEGDTLPDGKLVDQHGNEVCLWQFYGKVLVVDVSTMWCAPCKKIACYAEDTYKTYADDDVVYITVIPQNTHGQEPTAEDIDYWVDTYTLTGPVLADPKMTWSAASTPNQTYPAIMVVDREMKVAKRVDITGEADAVDRNIRLAIEAAGDIPHVDEEPVSACE
jgi:peroxiredoxin